MKILFQIQRDERLVMAYLGSKSGDKEVQDLFFLLQKMANQRERLMVSASPELMTNLQRLVLYSAYHMNYYDDGGHLTDEHDVYLTVPLEHDFAQKQVDVGHLSSALIQVFEVFINDGVVSDDGKYDPVFVESLLGTLGAMRPVGHELQTLKIQLVDDKDVSGLETEADDDN